MARPVHFEIHAADPERAVAFYRALFDWTITKWDGPWPYWLVKTGSEGPGIDGGIIQRRGAAPASDAPCNAFVCTIGVDDIDATLAKAQQIGAKVVVPKMDVPGVGTLAYVHDTEGNIVGVLQPVPM